MAPTDPTDPTAPAGDGTDGPMVTVFRSRLRDAHGRAYGTMAAEMDALARTMPGFVDAKTFAADDGERVTLVTFADRASHDAWRDNVRHGQAQRAGRDRFYAQYRLQVCRCEKDVHYTSGDTD